MIMAVADATIQLGEIFLETADGSKISLGQLKAPINISFKPAWEKPVPALKIGSTVLISDNPKCVECTGEREGWVDPKFGGKTATISGGPNERGDWHVKISGNKYTQLVSPEHLTVVA